MADVKLNTLPQSTSPTSTQDLLLFDESTNAGQRINYNTLADVILAKLTSKTYTVGGGTQTLISAIDALNSKTKAYDYTAQSGSFLDWALSTFTTNGEYYVVIATLNSVGLPRSATGIATVTKRNSDIYVHVVYGTKDEYITTYISNAWTEWTKYPMRAEVDALKNTLSPTLSGCGSNSTIHAVQIGTVVAVTAKIEYSGTSNMAISGLPNHNGDAQNGFVVTARDQTDGSIVRMWTNGGKNIMKYDNLTEGHMYGLSYTYITA